MFNHGLQTCRNSFGTICQFLFNNTSLLHLQKPFKYGTESIFRNLKYLLAASFTTASILLVMLAITLQPNHYLFAQTIGGNTSTVPGTVNVDVNKTGDEILHRGITVSEEFDHPYLNNTHRAIVLPFREDGRTYVGILNFRAFTPVEVILGQRGPVDSATLSRVEKEFGDLEEGHITHGTVKVLAADQY